ncbi:death-on-curing family protein [Thermoplasmatales archaeon]|nr:death-on-curing family protein [Thermoplasmatales archaeon]
MIEAISQKPELTVSGEKLYRDIFKEAASLMESIIRMHPFVDGNKRTSLAVLIEYLWKNGYVIFLPLNSVRRTVLIAMATTQDEDSVNNLLDETSVWIEKYAFKKGESAIRSLSKLAHSFSEPVQLYILIKLKLKSLAVRKITKWFAFDIFPRDKSEILISLDFLNLKLKDVAGRIRKDIKNIRDK